MIGEIDQDGNGCISFNEFLYLMTKNVHEDGDIEEEIREAFRVFDKSGDGLIHSDVVRHPLVSKIVKGVSV